MSIFVFSQNVKLDSIEKYAYLSDEYNIIVTTQYLFENEKEYLNLHFNECKFFTFSDFLSDKEMAEIDEISYESNSMDYEKYLRNIKKNKNGLVSQKVIEKYPSTKRYIFSGDLGIDLSVWKKSGFKYLKCQYYYKEPLITKNKIKIALKRIPGLKKIKNYILPNPVYHDPAEVFAAKYKGRKYVFLGKLNRIGYRLDIEFKPSEEECDKLNKGIFDTKENCTYMTTWHEHGKCNIPDESKYDVRWSQDGYLPPNYSHKDYFFKPENVKYYCWDVLGTSLFKNQKLPYEMIPFRKKLYLPIPKFPIKAKNILIVASGSGDWTALKNRSDDDIMVEAFVEMARRFPDIHFTYRCHPTWVHPENVGVNAINRVHEYFQWLNYPNLTLSSNIPPMNTADGYQYSFPRSSLEEDLANADFVIGEHSISMIDAAFKEIPFFSVNLTGRRNFFVGINELGFPSCKSLNEIERMIKSITTDEFKTSFLKAVNNYNKMWIWIT